MYKVYIDGVYLGHFALLDKAMIEVDRWAKQFNKAWRVVDPSGEVCAKSDIEPADHFSKMLR